MVLMVILYRVVYAVRQNVQVDLTLSSARWHVSNTDLSDLSILGTEPDYFPRHYLPLGGIFQILIRYCFDGFP